MSTTIDDRVVSMRFDNKHFEKNAQTSISTLAKLKQSLNLSGAAKGLQDIDKAAKKVDMSSLGDSAHKVGLKFNAMYTMADQALRNITTRVQHCAENIVKAFTVDPIKTGLAEYETQIGAIQTILANTQSKGSTLEDVNRALDELNTYADKTIYNFTEMTRNIGTFTAAGVDLDKSVTSIKGIANLAAVSGSTSQQASTAMYQLSQALASGTVKLMDWNSVVNAGMGGQVFQDALKRTATQMGHNVDEMIKKYGSFRESLTQGEWLTAEVLTETLTQLSGAYSKADLIAQGYTEKQAQEIVDLANTAVDAATKVKTFTQLMDTLKESAQSGWTQTWELIVGDFEEAKSLWTSISEAIGGFIGETSERRNTMLAGALNSNWEKLIEKVNAAGVTTENFEKRIHEVAKSHNIDIDSIVEKHGSLEDAFRKGAISTDILKEALGSLTAVGEKVKKIDLSSITKPLKRGQTSKDVQKVEEALEALGYSIVGKDDKSYLDGFFGSVTEDQVKKFQKDNGLKVTGIVDQETLAALDAAVNKTKELDENAIGAVESFQDLVDGITELGGREILIKSFASLFNSIARIVKPIGKAFRDIFPPTTSEQLFNLIKGFQQFTGKFNRWTRSTDGKKFIDNLATSFKGVFAAVDIVAKVVGGALTVAFKTISKLVGPISGGFLKFTSTIAKAIIKFRDWITEGTRITDWFSNLGSNIAKGIKVIAGWIKAFFELPEVQKNLSKIKMEFGEIKKALSGRFAGGLEKFKEFIDRVKSMDNISLKNIGSIFKDFYDNVIGYFIKTDTGTIFDGLINSLRGFKDKAKTYLESAGVKFVEIKDKILGFIGAVKKFIGDNAGGLLAIGGLLSIFLLFKKIKEALEVLTKPLGFLEDLGDVLGDLGKALKKKIQAETVKSLATSLAILAGSLAVLALLPTGKLWSAVGAITVMAVVMGGLVLLLSKVGDKLGNTGDLMKIATSILAISGSLLAFAFAAQIVAGIGWEGLGKTALIIGGMVAVVALLSKITKTTGAVDMAAFGSMMVGLSGALILLSIAIRIFGNMDLKTLIQGGVAVGVFFGMMRTMMASTKSMASQMPKFATMMAGLSASLLIMSVAVGILGRMDTKTLIQGGFAIGVFLLMMRGVMKYTSSMAKEVPRFASTMFSLSAGLLAMALTIKILAGIKDGDLIKGGIVMVGLIAILKSAMKATQLLTKNSVHAGKVGLMMLSFAASMVILTGAIAVLSLIKLGDLAKAVFAIGVVGGIFAGMVALTKYAKAGKGVRSTIMGMTIAVGVLAVSIAALSLIDPSKLAGATVALSAVMGMFALMTAMSKTIGLKGLGSMLAMAGIVAILGGIIYMLSELPADSAIGVAAALSILIASLSASCLILAAVGQMGPAAFIGIGVLAALMAVIGIFAGIAIASLPKIGEQLSKFMDNMSGFLKGAESIKPGMADGLKTLGEAMLIFTGIGWINALTFGIPLETMGKQFKIFGDALADFSNSIGGAKNFDTAKIKAAAEAAKELAGVSTALSQGTTFFDWLSNWTSDKTTFSSFTDNLKSFGEGLRDFNAAVGEDDFDTDKIKAAAEAAKDLAGISISLSQGTTFFDWISQMITGDNAFGTFSGNLKSFGEGLRDFNSAVGTSDFDADKIKKAAEAASTLAGVSVTVSEGTTFLDWVSKLTGGKDSFAQFATNLVGLGGGLSAFTPAIGTSSFDADNIKKAASAVSTLGEVSVNVAKGKTFLDWISSLKGEKDSFAQFATNLIGLGEGLSAFNTAIGANSFDADKIKKAASAASALAEVSVTVSEGKTFLDWISTLAIGEDSFSKFATNLIGLGSGLVSFNDAIGSNSFDADKIKKAAEAVSALAGVSVTVAEGQTFLDWISNLRGEEDSFTSFSNNLVGLGNGLVAFNTAIGTNSFDAGKIKSAAEAVGALASVSVTVSEGTSFLDWISNLANGEDSFTSFANNLSGLGTGLAAFNTAISGSSFDKDTMDVAISALGSLAEIGTQIGDDTAWSWLSGKDDLEDFGANLEKLGEGLSGFCDKISGDNFDIETISLAITQVRKLANIGSTITKYESLGSISVFGGHIKSLGSNLSSLYKNIKDIDADKFSAIATGLTDLSSITSDNANALTSFVESLGKVGADGINKFVEEFENAGPKVNTAGSNMLTNLIKGMTDKSPALAAAIKLIGIGTVTTINGFYSSFYTSGENLVRGFANGIAFYTYIAKQAAERMAKAAKEAAKRELDEHSPSREFYKIGAFGGKGFVNAFRDYESKAYEAGGEMAMFAKRGLSDAIAKVRDVIENGIDAQPTIRPVLDLSDVEAGVGAIGGMLGLRPSMGVLSNIGVVNSMMNRNQNGVNDDVVSAIERLGRMIGSTPNNVYNVNGVTYDDGSNISSAVQSLIKAAKVERRT